MTEVVRGSLHTNKKLRHDRTQKFHVMHSHTHQQLGTVVSYTKKAAKLQAKRRFGECFYLQEDEE